MKTLLLLALSLSALNPKAYALELDPSVQANLIECATYFGIAIPNQETLNTDALIEQVSNEIIRLTARVIDDRGLPRANPDCEASRKLYYGSAARGCAELNVIDENIADRARTARSTNIEGCAPLAP